MEPKLYFYKMMADNGGAPSIKDGLLSLAICKPMIRSTAREGDIIFGFASNTLYKDNVLIYIAVITKKLHNGDYYADDSFADRPDCIYKRSHKNRYVPKRDAAFHVQKDMQHDIGLAPHYSRANVLLSEEFRYFGEENNPSYKSDFPAIAKAIKKLMQGHRVNHSAILRRDLINLKDHIWARYTQTVTDIPVIPDNPNRCKPTPERSGKSCGVC